MSALVQTPIQHESNVIRTPLLTSVQVLASLIAGLQEHAKLPAIIYMWLTYKYMKKR